MMGSNKEYERLLMELRAIPFDVAGVLGFDPEENDEGIRIIAAWPHVTREIMDEPYEGQSFLHEAWGYVDFDMDEWGRMAGVPVMEMWKRWIPLAKQRLIYPDGTCPEKVRDLLVRRAEIFYSTEEDDVPEPMGDA